MKKLSVIALAALLYCGSASAQGPNQIVSALLGPNGPVQGLVQSLQQSNFKPLINGLAHNPTSLAQGQVAPPLNDELTGLLVTQVPIVIINNLTRTVREVVPAVVGGLGNQGLGRILLSSNGLLQVPLFGEAGEGPVAQLLASLPPLNVDNITRPLLGSVLFGAGLVTAGGKGMAPQEIPLTDISPAARAALINNVNLPAL